MKTTKPCRACGAWECRDCGRTVHNRNRFREQHECPTCRSMNGFMKQVTHQFPAKAMDHEDLFLEFTADGLTWHHPL